MTEAKVAVCTRPIFPPSTNNSRPLLLGKEGALSVATLPYASAMHSCNNGPHGECGAMKVEKVRGTSNPLKDPRHKW